MNYITKNIFAYIEDDFIDNPLKESETPVCSQIYLKKCQKLCWSADLISGADLVLMLISDHLLIVPMGIILPLNFIWLNICLAFVQHNCSVLVQHFSV